MNPAKDGKRGNRDAMIASLGWKEETPLWRFISSLREHDIFLSRGVRRNSYL
jgi:hypothetical protein